MARLIILDENTQTGYDYHTDTISNCKPLNATAIEFEDESSSIELAVKYGMLHILQSAMTMPENHLVVLIEYDNTVRDVTHQIGLTDLLSKCRSNLFAQIKNSAMRDNPKIVEKGAANG